MVNADIIMDRDEKSKGMGEVQFEDPADAIGAIGSSLCIRYSFYVILLVCL